VWLELAQHLAQRGAGVGSTSQAASLQRGHQPLLISVMKRRLVRWNGVLIRNPSPPTASITNPIRSATVSGEPMNSSSGSTASNRSIASWRSVLPLPHCANLSSEPCSPLVVRCASGSSSGSCEKSMSVMLEMPASERSMNAGDEIIRWYFACASSSVSARIG
jgi:hypothetical protein